MFREFAVTLAVAIVVSALLSLTLTAMMSAHLLKPEPKESERGRFYRWSEHVFEWMLAVYDRGLVWVLGHQRTTLFVTIATVAFTVVLALITPKGFFPQEDTGLVNAVTEAPPNSSFERMFELQQHVADVVRKDPGVLSVASFVGADGTNMTTNTGRLTINLKPRKERADAPAILARLDKELAKLHGVTVYLQSVQDLTIDARPSRTPFQYTIEDSDPVELAEWAPRLVEALSRTSEIRGVTSDLGAAGSGLELAIDRDTASRLGVTPQQIDDTLYDAFGQRQISTIFTQLNLYRVVLEVKPEMQRDPRALEQIYVKSGTGANVPLSTFVHVVNGSAPLAVNHQGQFTAVTISFDTAEGKSLGDAVDAVHRETSKLGMPPGVHGEFQGTAAAFRDSLASEPVLILAALITVYIVLGILYESLIHPITILSTLPSAGVGAFLALLVTRTDFTVIALIGIVLLIGIVKKNAIMMIDFAIEELKQGKTPEQAIHQACLLRFRPIMMTTMAALLGGLPLALGTGTGSELRRPLGITIVGGLLVSQVLTLYTDARHLSLHGASRGVAPREVPEEGGRGSACGGRMRLSEPFVRRPIATALLAVAIFLAGIAGYRLLPVAPLPRVDFPTVQVSAALPGASPEVMASSVATPLERRFGRIAGVTEITSTSSLGSANIILQFDLNRDVESAARDVQAAINAAGGELPADMPSRPNYRKVNPADAPIL